MQRKIQTMEGDLTFTAIISSSCHLKLLIIKQIMRSKVIKSQCTGFLVFTKVFDVARIGMS